MTGNTCSSTQVGSWHDYSGSFVWTGPTSEQAFGFEAISAASGNASLGNFLDDVQLSLLPFVDLNAAASSAPESEPIAQLPQLRISGDITSPLAITVNVVGGTATLGSDFTTPGGGANFVVTVPVGNYTGQSFPLGVLILKDTDGSESDETIEFEVPSNPAYFLSNTQTCGDPGIARSTYTIQEEKIELTKSATLNDPNGNGLSDAGETITYAFTVKNTGSVDLADVSVSDATAGVTVTGSAISLAAGASNATNFTASYTLKQADVDAGIFENQASVSGTVSTTNFKVTDLSDDPTDATNADPDNDGDPDDPTVVVLVYGASQSLEKTSSLNDANGNNLPDVGETISYAFKVTNTGNVTLRDIAVTDDKAVVSGSPIAGPLAPGASNTSVTGSYTITQADIDAGSVDNKATATGKDPKGEGVTAQSAPPGGTAGDPTTTPMTQEGKSTFLKEVSHDDANGNGAVDAGETLNYVFTVTNTGNVSLTNIVVTDTKATVLGSPIAGPLAPGASDTSAKGTYTVKQSDIDSGSVDNVAEMTAKDPKGNDVKAQSAPPGGTPGDSTSFPVAAQGAFDLVKGVTLNDANGNGFADAGETLSYVFTVTNTGNVSLTNIVVTDTKATVSGSPIAGPLAPGASDTSAKGTYTIRQADIDAGSFENTATATGKDPKGQDVTAQSTPPGGTAGDPTVIDLPSNASHRLEKASTLNDANGNGRPDAGETMNYSFTVTNTGNVSLTDIVVSDDKATVSGSPIAGPVEPGASDNSVTGSYTLTQADIDAGGVENKATSTAKDPTGNDVTAQSAPPGGNPGDPTVSALVQQGASDFVKEVTHDDANGNGAVDAGEMLNYVFTVTNTGNVSLKDIVVTDTKATVSGSPIAGPLAPGASDTSAKGTYTVKQTDIDSGNVDNVAEMVAKDPKGNDVKQTSRPPGGNPGESTSFPVEGRGEFDLVKDVTLNDTNGNGFADAGETLSYAFTVTNTGNVSLTNIVVTDTKAAVLGSPIAGPLGPGNSDTSVTGSYTITQADIDAGSFENTASAAGKDPKGQDVTAMSRPPNGTPGDMTVIAFEAHPSVELELIDTLVNADGDGYPQPGDTVTYAYRVVNTGNVTLTGITITNFDVTDTDIVVPARIAPSAVTSPPGGSIATLAPGDEDTTSFTASYSLKARDIESGRIDATAVVTGSAPNGDPVRDISNDPDSLGTVDEEGDEEFDNPTLTLLPQKLSLALEKSGAYQGAPGRFARAGDTILYTFKVTNDGNVPASNVKPLDRGPTFNGKPATGALSAFSPASANLDPGQSRDFTATYTLSDADVANAQNVEDAIVNKATAEGTGLKGRKAQAPEAVAVVNLPGFSITKMTPLSEVRRGGRVPYTIRVKPLGLSGSMVVNIVDQTPVGFAYVSGTATLDGTPATPKVEGRRLAFENVTLQDDQAVEIGLTLAVTAAAKPDEYINRAWVEDLSGNVVSFVARAVVEVVVEAVFDCGDILGKVFDDKNRNGYQDAGEPGLPGVRVATVKGLLVTSDQHGRFHVACAELPDQRIGTNYIMKLDPRSLPSGYRITTENPRVVRLTAGKASEFSFGASIGRVVRLDLTDEAFEGGVVELRPEWRERVSQLVTLLDQEPSVLRLSYYGADSRSKLVARRLKAVRKIVAEEWRSVGGRYRLEVETRAEAIAPTRTPSEPVYK